MPLTIHVHNRYRIHRGRQRRGLYPFDDAVSGASLFLFPIADRNAQVPIASLTQAPLAHTNRNGRARINMPGQNGMYVLRVVPDGWSTDEVGPSLGEHFTAVPDRIYRPLDVLIRVGGAATNTSVSTAITHGNAANGEIHSVTANSVKLLLQPVWITDFTGRRRTRSNIDLIVIHLTTGSSPYGAVRSIASHAGAHYLIVKGDGQIIKFVRDSIVGSHAGRGSNPGRSYWQGNTNINSRSIGIELENVTASNDNPEFSEAQYDSLLRLLDKLVTNHGVDRRRIIGHSDVAVWLDIKAWDPGLMFDWPRLDRQGFGLIGPGAGYYPSYRNLVAAGQSALGSGVYGGLFAGSNNDPVLRVGDNDNTATYGGRRRQGITGQPILDLVTDLNNIGYWVGPGGPTGRLTNESVRAAMHFQHHFFAMNRTTLPGTEARVRIDAETALMIRDVADANQ